MSDLLLPIFTVCGTVTSFLLLLAPLPAYIKAWRAQSSTGLSVEYILASNVSQIAWSLYGLKDKAVAILLPSGVGTAVTFGYLVVYRAISGPIIGFVLAYLVGGLVAITVIYQSLGESALGLICVFLSSANSLSALFQPYRAYLHRDPTLIDLNISLCLFLCGLCWTGYGLLSSDLFVLLPNLLCQLVAVVNISVKGLLDETWALRTVGVRLRGIWKESKLKRQTEGYFWV